MASSALDEALFQRITILSTERKKQLLDLHDNGCLDELLTIHGENEIKLLVELRNSRPQVLQDIIADDVPAEPVLNYIQDLDTRVHIFEEFRRLSNRVSARNSMNAAIFSVFMVAPITQLEYQLLELQNLERGGDLAGIAKYFGALASTSLGILAYANRGGRQSQSASSSSQNSPLPSPAPALASPSKRKPDSHERIPSASYPELQAPAPPMKATPQPSTPPANMLTYFIQQSPWSPPVQSATNSPQQSRNKTASNILETITNAF
ncbi:uncharacterized protein TrAFT101_005452 [Trichoderma asperellum]|uniref:uncharacterized protein n=1 Tax=Trichoderma asperellum TaxID=101201 RepID=UPI0033248D73|nr:hypothetical protein TrAFT101_005452 [Trichoderma asperellum]